MNEFPDWAIRSNVESKFKPTWYFCKSFDERTLYIDPQIMGYQNISTYINVLSSGSTDVETEYRRADAIEFFLSGNSSKFYRMNNDLRAVRGTKFIASQANAFSCLADLPHAHASQNDSEDGDYGCRNGGEVVGV